MKHLLKTTNRGAASLFVVIITILLLGVITLGFTRLILSETSQTSNTDLSQSAYDSALAGIEDAKLALLRYHSCLSEGGGGSLSAAPGTCSKLIAQMEKDIEDNSCDTVSNALGRTQNTADGESGGEVIIQETQELSTIGEYMSQAYTCVTVKEILEDYRTTLSATNRLRVIPIRTTDINSLAKITVEWYSSDNAATSGGSFSTSAYNGHFPPNNEAVKKTAPVISVQIIQPDQRFKLSELDASKNSNNTDIATLYLRPSTSGGSSITAEQVAKTASKMSQNDPFDTYCAVRSPFYCGTTINLPRTFNGSTSRNADSSFLVVSMPYGSTDTDVSITLKKSDGTTLPFTGVQAKVDSTGRANDLYRRVESRIELADAYFPYPEFAIQMTGNSDESSIEKSFYVTNSCWTSNNGVVETCENNGSATPGL